MNLLLLEPGEIGDGGLVRLRGRRADHLRAVHRIVKGSRLRAGERGGLLGRATVLEVTPEHVDLAVVLDAVPPRPSSVELIVALPRPKVLRRLLQTVVTLGVKRLCLVNAWRVEKSYFSSPQLDPERIHAELTLGLEQAFDTVPPVVTVHHLLRPFVEDEVPALWESAVHRLLADPGSAATIQPGGISGPCVVAIGPEGGWIEDELALFARHGFAPFSLGPRILKVESAVVTAVTLASAPL